MKNEVKSCFSVGPLIIMIMDDSLCKFSAYSCEKDEICDNLIHKVLEILAYGDIQKRQGKTWVDLNVNPNPHPVFPQKWHSLSRVTSIRRIIIPDRWF